MLELLARDPASHQESASAAIRPWEALAGCIARERAANPPLHTGPSLGPGRCAYYGGALLTVESALLNTDAPDPRERLRQYRLRCWERKAEKAKAET